MATVAMIETKPSDSSSSGYQYNRQQLLRMYPGRPGPDIVNPIGIRVHRFPPPTAKQRPGSQQQADDFNAGELGGRGPHSGAKGRGKGVGGKGGGALGFDTATGGKGLGKGKGREHEDTASSPDHHDDGWQVVKPKQGNRDWGALRGGRTAGDEEDGKPLPPWRRVAAHHPGAARRGDTSPVHSHGAEQHHRIDITAAEGDHYHHKQQEHSPSGVPATTPFKKTLHKEEDSRPKELIKPTTEATPTTPAPAVDPFTMALLRGASPEPHTNRNPPSSGGPFDTRMPQASTTSAAPPAAAAAPSVEASSSLFGDTTDSLFGPPLEHDGVVSAFAEGPARSASSGSRFARLFESLHADDPKPAVPPTQPSSGFPSTTPFSTSAPFAPVATSLFGGPPTAGTTQTPANIFGSPSSAFPVDRPAPVPRVPTTSTAQPAATATQAQLQHALLQQLRAAPPATTAKVQQILERASSNASSQGGGGVPALLQQLQAQAQQKREQAEEQARTMAATQQQQQAALVRLQQMQVQQQMKKLLQQQEQETKQQQQAQHGSGPSNAPAAGATTGMSALNRLISAGSSGSHSHHHSAPSPSLPTGGSALVGTPSPGLDVNALFWTYLDPHGHKQGPFSNAQMKTWHAASYFDVDLPLAFSTSSAPTPGSRFAPLNRIFPPGSHPFIDAPRPVGTAAAPPRPSSSTTSLGASSTSPAQMRTAMSGLEKQDSNISIGSSVHSAGRVFPPAGAPVPPPPPPVQPPVQPPSARRSNEGGLGHGRTRKPNRNQQQQQSAAVSSTSPPPHRSVSPGAALGAHSDRGRGRESASDSLRGLLGISTSESPQGGSDRHPASGSRLSEDDRSSVDAEQQRQHKQAISRGGRGGSAEGRPRTVYPRRPGDEKDKPKTVVAGKDVADPSSLHKGWLWSPSDEAAMRRKEAGGGGGAVAPVPKKMSLKEIMANETDANNIKALMTGHNPAAAAHKMKIPAAKKKSQKQLKKEAAAKNAASGSSS